MIKHIRPPRTPDGSQSALFPRYFNAERQLSRASVESYLDAPKPAEARELVKRLRLEKRALSLRCLLARASLYGIGTLLAAEYVDPFDKRLASNSIFPIERWTFEDRGIIVTTGEGPL